MHRTKADLLNEKECYQQSGGFDKVSFLSIYAVYLLYILGHLI